MKIKRIIKILPLPLLVAALNIMLIAHARESLDAARAGVGLWFNNVLPSVLPFIIGGNLLIGLGAVSFIGVLLEPVMRRVFNVPGVGGFALAVGMISGYPVGAKMVCEMRSRGELSRHEAQRLISFANNSGPLFILGAVGLGMFGDANIGRLMLLAHYLGSLAVGLIFRFYKASELSGYAYGGPSRPLHIRAVKAMEQARWPSGQFPKEMTRTRWPSGQFPKEMTGGRRHDNTSFGQIMRHSVVNAMETMLLVGGFIVLFSVTHRTLEIAGLYYLLGEIFGIPEDLRGGVFGGIIEMTNGVNQLSILGASPIIISIATALISFGGISILFQSLSFISKTDIDVGIYILAKIAHGVFSGIFIAFLL